MTYRQYSDWSSDLASTIHRGHSSIERIVSTDDGDHDRIDQNKTSFTWYWCFKCCIFGSLLAGIGLAIVLTFWLTSKTTATETLISTTVTTTTATTVTTTTTTTATTTTATTTTTTITTTTTTTTTTATTTTVTTTTVTTATTTTVTTTTVTTATTTTATTATTTTATTTTTTATTTTTTTTTTAPTCGTFPTIPSGQILHYFPKSGSNFPLLTYTQYTSSFTASSTLATLSFIIMGEGGGGAIHYWLIDDVVANHTNANANVLTNGGFETGDLSGWKQYCNTTANCDATNGKTTGNYVHTTTSSCYSGSYCVYDSCLNTDYLEQSFSTVVGDYYIISYYLRNGNNDAGPIAMYVTLT
ncbi:unnamed protein product [Adineta steineri]|uniref:Uncharacterized protein n=1 Tax=Adineta steineri TaxID=433720 RepID=A0A814QYF0_9BILA|nr:unnamed protein product [Adineta steineri]CAF4077728.1 unnamed protein product [Adineta steineri]